MKDKDLLVDRVSKKTNVKKEDIFKEEFIGGLGI